MINNSNEASHFHNPEPIRISDRLTLFLMQQLGISTGAEEIVLSHDEELELAERQQKITMQEAVKYLVDDILVTDPEIKRTQLTDKLIENQILDTNLLDIAVAHCLQRQRMRI